MTSMESASKSATWRCPRCHLETDDFPAITRRNVGYAENSKICSNCGELEALVDWADDITSMIHWEFSFHQMCCGNATQDGHDEFHKFLAFRKLVGKHDPPLWKIEWLIWEKMFGSTPDTKKLWMKKSKARYVEIEAKWNTQLQESKKVSGN